MTHTDSFVTVEIADDHVATVRLCRPPNNFFSVGMIETLASALESLDDDPMCRAVVLAADGKHFCAGADFSAPGDQSTAALYRAAVRLFRTGVPIVAAVQGAAIGGGLGLALAADFRVGAPEARFSANFARLGFHQGFGLSVTLPALVGQQRAAELLYTGRRIGGEAAAEIGLVDRLVALGDLLSAAHELAAEIAGSAPLAVRSIRATLRGDLADRVAAATDHEMAEQERLRRTPDFREGTRAMAERRAPIFTGETA
jgi:enoyl-CoA hydratase/carnithine racemase